MSMRQLEYALLRAGFVRVEQEKKTRGQVDPELETKPDWAYLSEQERAEYRVLFTR